MLKRKILGVGALLFFAGGFLVFQLVRGGPSLIIENRSKEKVVELKVRTSAESITFRDVKEGVEVAARLKVEDGEKIVLDVKLADGSVSHGQARFVRGGKLRGVIRPGGMIDFQQSDR